MLWTTSCALPSPCPHDLHLQTCQAHLRGESHKTSQNRLRMRFEVKLQSRAFGTWSNSLLLSLFLGWRIQSEIIRNNIKYSAMITRWERMVSSKLATHWAHLAAQRSHHSEAILPESNRMCWVFVVTRCFSVFWPPFPTIKALFLVPLLPLLHFEQPWECDDSAMIPQTDGFKALIHRLPTRNQDFALRFLNRRSFLDKSSCTMCGSFPELAAMTPWGASNCPDGIQVWPWFRIDIVDHERTSNICSRSLRSC